MEAKTEVNLGKFVARHASQVKLVSRQLEQVLEAAKGAREITIDRELVEIMLDTLEIFTDDCDGVSGASRDRTKTEPKPVVARLN